MPAHSSTFGNFNPDPEGESWEEYVERLQFYFIATATKESHKLAVLLTVVGVDTFRTMRSVVAPTKLDSLSYSEVVTRMGSHFNPVGRSSLLRVAAVDNKSSVYSPEKLPSKC